MSDVLRVTRDDGVVVLMIDNPPVNALSLRLRESLYDALRVVRDDASARAVVIACAGRTFIAGADIAEFSNPRGGPLLREIIELLERLGKPSIAAIHGNALGGGLEFAMGCHYRVAQADARLGQPEVTLGLLPGAGGTQRLPRLVGPMRALQAIMSGESMTAPEALEAGLVDAVFDGDLLANATAFAREVASRAKPAPPVSKRDAKLRVDDAALARFDAEVARLLRAAPGVEAMVSCALSIRNSMTMPFEQASDVELTLSEELIASEQSRALRYLFFASRQAHRVPSLDKGTKPTGIAQAAILGPDHCVAQIASSFAAIGVRTASAHENLPKGSIPDRRPRHEMARPCAVLVADAGPSQAGLPGHAASRPGQVIALNFFHPTQSTRVVEIVRTDDTEPGVLSAALSVAKALGKVPVVTKAPHDAPCVAMLRAAAQGLDDLLSQGVPAHRIDEALANFGWSGGTRLMADRVPSSGSTGRSEEGGSSSAPTPDLIARMLYPMVNAGARQVEDGAVIRTSDLDVLFVYGLGFPAVKGGPMYWAERVGLAGVVADLDRWFLRTGHETYRPAGLLRELARQNLEHASA